MASCRPLGIQTATRAAAFTALTDSHWPPPPPSPPHFLHTILSCTAIGNPQSAVSHASLNTCSPLFSSPVCTFVPLTAFPHCTSDCKLQQKQCSLSPCTRSIGWSWSWSVQQVTKQQSTVHNAVRLLFELLVLLYVSMQYCMASLQRSVYASLRCVLFVLISLSSFIHISILKHNTTFRFVLLVV